MKHRGSGKHNYLFQKAFHLLLEVCASTLCACQCCFLQALLIASFIQPMLASGFCHMRNSQLLSHGREDALLCLHCVKSLSTDDEIATCYAVADGMREAPRLSTSVHSNADDRHPKG